MLAALRSCFGVKLITVVEVWGIGSGGQAYGRCSNRMKALAPCLNPRQDHPLLANWRMDRVMTMTPFLLRFNFPLGRLRCFCQKCWMNETKSQSSMKTRSSILGVTCGITAILAAAVILTPHTARAAERNAKKRLLVVTVTKGFRHGSIPMAERTIEDLGKKTGNGIPTSCAPTTT